MIGLKRILDHELGIGATACSILFTTIQLLTFSDSDTTTHAPHPKSLGLLLAAGGVTVVSVRRFSLGWGGGFTSKDTGFVSYSNRLRSKALPMLAQRRFVFLVLSIPHFVFRCK